MRRGANPEGPAAERPEAGEKKHGREKAGKRAGRQAGGFPLRLQPQPGLADAAKQLCCVFQILKGVCMRFYPKGSARLPLYRRRAFVLAEEAVFSFGLLSDTLCCK